MAEFKLKPSGTDSDPDNLEWATGAVQGVDYIEPAPAKRSSGWVFQDVPPYQTLNWFYRLVAGMVTWLTAWRIRAYSDLESAATVIASGGVDDGHIFILGRPSGFTAPLSAEWSVAGIAGTDVTSVACDGEFVYYSQGANTYRTDRATGASNLASYAAGADVNWVFADGGCVQIVTDADGNQEVIGVDRLAMTALGSFPSGNDDNTLHVSSNGLRFIVAEGDFDSAQIYNCTGGTFGTINHGAQVQRVAVDYEQYFIGGLDAGGGIRMRAFSGSLSPLWTSDLPDAVNFADMVSDGDQLFIATEVMSVGPNDYNIASYDRETGALNWIAGAPDATSPVNAECLCVDDRWLYVASGNSVYQVDKYTGATVRSYDHGAAVTSLSCDGDAIFIGGAAGTGGARLRRLNRGLGSSMWIKASGTDINRRPFARLAIPTGERQ